MKHFPEHELQVLCITWFRLTYPKISGLLFAIPNGAKLAGNPIQRARAWKRLEAEGARPGVADLFLAVPAGKYAGLFIEMKVEKGTQRPAQKTFEKDIVQAGYGYAIPRDLETFIEIVQQYLKNGVY